MPFAARWVLRIQPIRAADLNDALGHDPSVSFAATRFGW
jgi:hypothetical protein